MPETANGEHTILSGSDRFWAGISAIPAPGVGQASTKASQVLALAKTAKGAKKVLDQIKIIYQAPVNPGTQTNSTTTWKGKGKERIDVENANPSQRPGQVHYQDNNGNKYIFDPTSGTFPGATKKVNELLDDPSFRKGIQKGLKYLGYF